MEKRLYRVEQGKMITGLCGGIGEYFGIDPTLVRLGAVLFCALGGCGVLAYLVGTIIIPKKSKVYPMP